jgi:hypothetical protein
MESKQPLQFMEVSIAKDSVILRLVVGVLFLSRAESVLYLLVEDIEGAYENMQSRGIEFVNTPHLIHRQADGTEEWMAFFRDPEGRPLAMMSQVKP